MTAEQVTAGASAAVALLTLWLVTAQLKTARRQLQAEFYLKLRDRFDSAEFHRARKSTAALLLNHRLPDEDTVFDFFEDMGMLLRREYLDQQMVCDTFSWYILGWWDAGQKYVVYERARNDNDTSLFQDFEFLNRRCKHLKHPRSTEQFLKDEAGSPTKSGSERKN
jgi:hypothetical protein